MQHRITIHIYQGDLERLGEQGPEILTRFCHDCRWKVVEYLQLMRSAVGVIWLTYSGGTTSAILIDVELFLYNEPIELDAVLKTLTNFVTSGGSSLYPLLEGKHVEITVREFERGSGVQERITVGVG